ncbi:hypothetical protein CTI12_AA201060 [Artemisia annua]|uniref:Uncharacterized protein n=1 Tax=Artemisia annua TaxID=35608 RepID=A0A2U1P2E0_ARTAN|nr:hypothetical protein CTI12_AA201060 [Artemisia annua]
MASPSTPHVMSCTPTFQELRKVADSDDLQDVFHLLFSQDFTENEGLITVLEQKRDDFLMKIECFKKLIVEGESFCPFHEGGDMSLEFMKETLERDKKMVAGLISVLDLAREGRNEKKRHLRCCLEKMVAAFE